MALDRHHEKELGNRNGSYYGRNNISLKAKWEISIKNLQLSAITKAFNQLIKTLHSPGSFLSNLSVVRKFFVSSTHVNTCNNTMAREGSQNASANWDLKKSP